MAAYLLDPGKQVNVVCVVVWLCGCVVAGLAGLGAEGSS